MSRIQRARFCVVAFDADGDMEDSGITLGAVNRFPDAMDHSDRLDRAMIGSAYAERNLTTLVVPLAPAGTAAIRVLQHVFD
jgi:hypothetical protein